MTLRCEVLAVVGFPHRFFFASLELKLRKWGFVDPAANTTCRCGTGDDTVQH